MADCPIALHFSGHGVQNTQKNIGQQYFFSKDKGNALILEDSVGKAEYFFESELKFMIKEMNNPFEVVFVSSCHSQFAGEIFINAGAKHVICIKQEFKISDAASLKFSSVFYESLFDKGMSVCQAFNIAKKEVESEINISEANKFKLLLPNNDNDTDSMMSDLD